MGVEPFLLASSLLGVLAQRLVRQLCALPPSHRPSAAGNGCLGTARPRNRRADAVLPAGCKAATRGYRGRTGIYELVEVDESLRTHDP